MDTPIKVKVNISSWKRREHYNFFRQFEQPFFGVTKVVNCTAAYRYCKAYGTSFLMYYLHKSLVAANKIPEFRYRIERDEVVEYLEISGSITVLRNDETFGFTYFDVHHDFQTFAAETQRVITMEKVARSLKLKPELNSLIHFSILPGLYFSSMQHAQMLASIDSVPKVVFGKLEFEGERVLLPVSVHVNHALCDGLHVSRFYEVFTRLMQLT